MPQSFTGAGSEGQLPKVEARPSADSLCRALARAAADNGLPVEFLTRLIWLESRFNPDAVSPKGAQGIAQFMPRTASGRGLTDPFEPLMALREAASYLRELRTTFSGNLGLASAAYNAGPGRVEAWLSGPPRPAGRDPHVRASRHRPHALTPGLRSSHRSGRSPTFPRGLAVLRPPRC